MAYTTIDDPSAYFHTQLYSGTGSAQSITNDANAGDFKPDWVWVKKRTGGTARNHTLTDSSRGATKGLFSSLNDAEATNAQGLTSFNSDGFSVGTYNNFNESDGTYVGWQWIANGGTTSSNTDGSITSTVQANTTAGFSIVTWTGNGSNSTIGHGLGAVPKMVICKNRDSAGTSWQIYHAEAQSSGADQLKFTTDAVASNTAVWNNTAPSSSVFTVGTGDGVNKSGDNLIAYCFAEKKGYSKFGSYTGNGNDNGAFVYTGFKPKFAIFKAVSVAGEGWAIRDSARSPFNQMSNKLSANTSAAEGTVVDDNDCDFVSNGIKLRSNDNQMNYSGATFIYYAVAEHPLVSSEGVPTIAR